MQSVMNSADHFQPTDDGPHPLTAYPKPDAQGAAPKVRFVVLRLQVARPGFGQKLSSSAWLRAAGSAGCQRSFVKIKGLLRAQIRCTFSIGAFLAHSEHMPVAKLISLSDFVKHEAALIDV